MTAYYNEFDPKAAAWLRELIRAGEVAPGDVDERSIEDVTPADLAGYTQCHFFAGIGVWSYALREAGWPDDRPIWTGSCPCQPFSAAGKGAGFADERHLWPAFHWLISQCQPDAVLGEQVASKDGLTWFDLVSTDLEGTGYSCWPSDTCAAGFGAPHIRQRLYWAAERLDYTTGARRFRPVGDAEGLARDEARLRLLGVGEQDGGLADPMPAGRAEGWAGAGNGSVAGIGGVGRLADPHDARPQGRREPGRECAAERAVGADGLAGGLADTKCSQRGEVGFCELREIRGEEGRRQAAEFAGSGGDHCPRPGPTDGHWRDADWLFCRDGKWRPVEPGTFPLAHGAAERVGRLRGYGNAIVAPAAQAFIEAYEESRAERLRLMSEMTTDKGVFA